MQKGDSNAGCCYLSQFTSKYEVENFGSRIVLDICQVATGWHRREIVGSIECTMLSFVVHWESVLGVTDRLVVENQSTVNYFAPGIFPKTWRKIIFGEYYVSKIVLADMWINFGYGNSENFFDNLLSRWYFEFILEVKIKWETRSFTFERSTPVRAWTAGGTWPTRRVSSPERFSLPPRRTISSVLASGAATSAAIWRRRRLFINNDKFFCNAIRDFFKLN